MDVMTDYSTSRMLIPYTDKMIHCPSSSTACRFGKGTRRTLKITYRSIHFFSADSYCHQRATTLSSNRNQPPRTLQAASPISNLNCA